MKKVVAFIFFWAALTELMVNLSNVWEMVRTIDARTGLTVIFIIFGVAAAVLYFVEKYRQLKNRLDKKMQESVDHLDRAITKFANNMDRYYHHHRQEDRVLQESIDALMAALRADDHAPHGSEQDTSLIELRREVDIMKKQVMEVDEKLLDLKLKIVEKLGKVPEWWKE